MPANQVEDLPDSVRHPLRRATEALTRIARGEPAFDDLADAFQSAAAAARAEGSAGALPSSAPRPSSMIAGTRMKALRSEAGWTQPRLAEAMVQIGWPKWQRVTVAQVERGDRRLTFEELASLAALFGVPFVELFAEPAFDLALPGGAVPREHLMTLLIGSGGSLGTGGIAWEPAEAACSLLDGPGRPSASIWSQRAANGGASAASPARPPRTRS